MRRAVWPTSPGRRSPQLWVRRMSPRKSNSTSGISNLLILFRLLRFREIIEQAPPRERGLLTGTHIFQRIRLCDDLVVSQDEREARIRLVGQLQHLLQLASRAYFNGKAKPSDFAS